MSVFGLSVQRVHRMQQAPLRGRRVDIAQQKRFLEIDQRGEPQSSWRGPWAMFFGGAAESEKKYIAPLKFRKRIPGSRGKQFGLTQSSSEP